MIKWTIVIIIILSPTILWPAVTEDLNVPKIIRRMPNPLRRLLIKYVWKNRHNIKPEHQREFALAVGKIPTLRRLVDKQRQIIYIIRILWDDNYLTKEQYDELIDAADKAYPLSSFSTNKKGQCPFAFASPIFKAALKQLKGNGKLMSDFITLIERVQGAICIQAKILLHGPLFTFLSEKLNLDPWNCSFIKLEDIFCKHLIGFYWDFYKICASLGLPETEDLGKAIEFLKEAKRVNDAVCYHREIFRILNGAKLPARCKKALKGAKEYARHYYGLNT
jgi:hypothetical protein